MTIVAITKSKQNRQSKIRISSIERNLLLYPNTEYNYEISTKHTQTQSKFNDKDDNKQQTRGNSFTQTQQNRR